MPSQGDLFDASLGATAATSRSGILHSLGAFTWNDRETRTDLFAPPDGREPLPILTNEFWTSRQRAGHSLHELSYRACFKPQLPEFFINLLTRPGEVVYDPFAGRGTTLIEAALRGRIPAGCDINPLSEALVRPRLAPPALRDVIVRLDTIDLTWADEVPEDLLTFYHPETLAAICALRRYLLERASSGLDPVDDWIRMIALNRLTGHSPGFLSVYTLPPNQAASVVAQRKINADRKQIPPRRDLKHILTKKSAALLDDVDPSTRRTLRAVQDAARFRVGSSAETFWEPASVDLVVTSPPFLDVVNYAGDNWLRCWFCGIPAEDVPIELHRKLADWAAFIERVLRQCARLLRAGGFVAFEVGEVRAGTVRLEETVVPCGIGAGLTPVCIVINEQTFTKTANIWGVANNAKGTNTNRIVIFQKPESRI